MEYCKHKLIVLLARLSIFKESFVMSLLLQLSCLIDDKNVHRVKIRFGCLVSGLKVTFCTFAGDSMWLMQLVEQSQTQVNGSFVLVYLVLGSAFALTMP